MNCQYSKAELNRKRLWSILSSFVIQLYHPSAELLHSHKTFKKIKSLAYEEQNEILGSKSSLDLEMQIFTSYFFFFFLYKELWSLPTCTLNDGAVKQKAMQIWIAHSPLGASFFLAHLHEFANANVI